MNLQDLTLDLEQHGEVEAGIDVVFQSVLHRFGEGNMNPAGDSLQRVLEQWPGGRWFRDRGNGAGHLWDHVQVIKPPVLLELSGPLFMSYPAMNHVGGATGADRRWNEAHAAPQGNWDAESGSPGRRRTRVAALDGCGCYRLLAEARMTDRN